MNTHSLRSDHPVARKLLLIGWDGADWEHITPLLDQGLLPTLESFINAGVMGNLATLQPILSPMLWNSVATGKLPDKHGIHGFIEPDPVNGGVRPCCSTSRKCKALWNIFTQVGLTSNVVGWWASHPAEPIRGTIVSNSFNGTRWEPDRGWRVAPGTIHPAEKAGFLAQLRVLPSELTHEHIFPFIPQAARVDQDSDPLLQSFGKVLSDCASTHAVATALLEQESWDFTAIYYDTIDHLSHAFMPFHPPRMPQVAPEMFEIYRDVIAGAYRFHDMMLERLLQLAGEDCTVILCSDHGFHSRHLRPKVMPREPAGPAIWHREYGILAMRGPGIRRDERIYGASLIDIGPTILTLMGLPIGQDMDGRPLTEACEVPPEIRTISSWEDLPGECGMHQGEPDTALRHSDELMQQFVALGYIEDPGDDKEKAAENAQIEAQYNLARTYLWTGRPDQAQQLLEDAVRRRSWESRFWHLLANCYFQQGYFRQAGDVIEAMYEDPASMPAGSQLLLGQVHAGLKDLPQAVRLFEAAEQAEPRLPHLHIHLGLVYLKLRRFADAERAFHTALQIDGDSARAYLGLSNVYRRTRRNQESAEAALEAVSRIHRTPMAHFNLGVAMARTGDYDRAIVAFETALKFRGSISQAHRWLATIYRTERIDPERAAYHKTMAEKVRAELQAGQRLRLERKLQTFELPGIPSPRERKEALDAERPLPVSQPPVVARSGRTFVLVSGLPRSGTSLMMQMLAAGGLPPQTDELRPADDDNPEGYLEWEAIKQLQKRPGLFDEPGLEGKAIKVISMLLKHLPRQHDYKVIFMTRPIEEVAASQGNMLERLGNERPHDTAEALESQLRQHRQAALQWLRAAPHTDVLEVDFPHLVRQPETWLPRLVKFLGPARLPNAEAMLSAVRPELHRKRVACASDGAVQSFHNSSKA